MNNELKDAKVFKTHILLPVIFIITTAVAVCFVAVDDFVVDLSPLIVWLYFGVVNAYIIVALLDLLIHKERGKKQKIFIIVMMVLSLISSVAYATLYLLAKGR